MDIQPLPSLHMNMHGKITSPLPEIALQPIVRAESVPTSPLRDESGANTDRIYLQAKQRRVHEKQSLFPIISTLLQTLKAKDAQLYRHSRKVHYLTNWLSRELRLSQHQVTAIGLGALLHDIGKIGIEDALLQRAGLLTVEEFEIIKKHPAYGASILSRYSELKQVIPVVYSHHERWDGQGYPRGLQGETIPLGARIVAIADAFEVMTSSRVYQPIRTRVEALEELCVCAGTQFDPFLVERFCNSPKHNLFTQIDWKEVERGYLRDR